MRCHGPIINIATTRRLHTFYCSSQLYQVRGAGTVAHVAVPCPVYCLSTHITLATKLNLLTNDYLYVDRVKHG